MPAGAAPLTLALAILGGRTIALLACTEGSDSDALVGG